MEPIGLCMTLCHLGEAMHQPASANGAARQHEANQGSIRAFNHSDTSAGMLVKRVKLKSRLESHNDMMKEVALLACSRLEDTGRIKQCCILLLLPSWVCTAVQKVEIRP